MFDDPKAYLSVEETAARLGVSVSFLNKARCYGGGPVFHKFGRMVRYAIADLDAWARERARMVTVR